MSERVPSIGSIVTVRPPYTRPYKEAERYRVVGMDALGDHIFLWLRVEGGIHYGVMTLREVVVEAA